MLWIIGGQTVLLAFARIFADPVPNWLTYQLDHAEWIGFTAYDLIFPLFLFVSGVSLPFSIAKWTGSGRDRRALYRRLVRRIVLLWVLGMMVQGNLLLFDISRLHLYSNALQCIAVGYLVAVILMLTVSIRGQAIATGLLLVGYWALMRFVPVPGHGAGVLEPTVNLARYIDEVVLGGFRYGGTYTWLLNSMGFAASLLFGVLGGHVLRSAKSQEQKSCILAGLGAGCLCVGWIWGIWFPIIKHIWTSSMALWAGGWCFLLLAAFYWLIDVKGWRKWAFPLVVIGMNAIGVYVTTHLVDFGYISKGLVGHLAARMGSAGPFVVESTALLIVWLILLYLYRKKTFLRV